MVITVCTTVPVATPVRDEAEIDDDVRDVVFKLSTVNVPIIWLLHIK